MNGAIITEFNGPCIEKWFTSSVLCCHKYGKAIRKAHRVNVRSFSSQNKRSIFHNITIAISVREQNLSYNIPFLIGFQELNFIDDSGLKVGHIGIGRFVDKTGRILNAWKTRSHCSIFARQIELQAKGVHGRLTSTEINTHLLRCHRKQKGDEPEGVNERFSVTHFLKIDSVNRWRIICKLPSPRKRAYVGRKCNAM